MRQGDAELQLCRDGGARAGQCKHDIPTESHTSLYIALIVIHPHLASNNAKYSGGHKFVPTLTPDHSQLHGANGPQPVSMESRLK